MLLSLVARVSRSADLGFEIRGFDSYRHPTAGSAPTRPIAKPGLIWPDPTKRYFVYSRTPAYNTEAVRTQRDLWYLKCEDEATGCEEVPFLQTPSDESLGQLSPDGRLIAYCSDESGRKEVYVRRFPQGADKWQVSFNGGAQPRWSRDGQELFYVEKNALIAVSVQTRPNFSVGSPERSTVSLECTRPRPATSAPLTPFAQRFSAS